MGKGGSEIKRAQEEKLPVQTGLPIAPRCPVGCMQGRGQDWEWARHKTSTGTVGRWHGQVSLAGTCEFAEPLPGSLTTWHFLRMEMVS